MYHIIVNPASKSGHGRKMWDSLEPVFKEKKIMYDVVFSKHTGHIIQYVEKLTSSLSNEPLRLIILGGDGTLNEVLQGVSDFDKLEIGYIPTGSSNDLARDLQLPKDPRDVLERILSGQVHRLVDIGSVTYNETKLTRFFAVSSGIGFDAAVCQEALVSRFKKALNKIGLGKLTYLAIALKQIITAKKVACNIYLDNSTEPVHYKKFLFAAGMVHQYEGGGFKFCPGADTRDGLLDICVVGSLPKPIILLALPTAFWGKHLIFPGIDSYRCQTLTIETSTPLWVHTDGESEQRSRSVTMTCYKEKLHLLV